MKKIIYSLFVAVTLTLTITSCTEEEIKPKDIEASNGGGTSLPGGYK